jgi:uncharacterized membrane protein YgdD (TMEM256/DUF423 family)
MPFWLLIAALMGLVGVALDAVGTHALADASAEDRTAFATAARYQLLHALALFGVAWLASRKAGARLVWMAGSTFTVGVILFCGSIYLNVLAGIQDLEAAPVGGVCLMVGWALIALYAVLLLRKSDRK